MECGGGGGGMRVCVMGPLLHVLLALLSGGELGIGQSDQNRKVNRARCQIANYNATAITT
jgi:hypothetical protein